MFTALGLTALDRHMSLGYKPPVFLEAIYIKPPSLSGWEMHALLSFKTLLLPVNSPNKVYLVLELSAPFFGFPTLSSIEARVQDTREVFPQPICSHTHWSSVAYGILPSSYFQVCGYVRMSQFCRCLHDGSGDAPRQKASDK